ncbi:orotidine 5'-phosphate decarboxylase / HUMPS family protein [Helicobacter sp. T3_23-1056]
MNLVIALDLPSLEQNLRLIKSLDFLKDSTSHDLKSSELKSSELKSKIWLKVGLRAFVRDGIAGIEAIKNACDLPIFLDLKLYDIPNTMADAVQECAKIGIDMLTIHASAGQRAMQEIMARLENFTNQNLANEHLANQNLAQNPKADSTHAIDLPKHNPKKPLIMAVSALTSFDEAEFSAVYHKGIKQAVSDFASMCDKSRINGMVCSVQECAFIKKSYPHLLTLTPAIRPNLTTNIAKNSPQTSSNKTQDKTQNKTKDDQKRVASIQEAYNAGADFIVVGRPIYNAPSPQNALRDILQQMQNLS